MDKELTLEEIQKRWPGTLKAYLIGFLSSILITLASFSLVLTRALPAQSLIGTVALLALLQAVIQLRFFLHVGEEPRPRWKRATFCSMLLILLTIAVGSLWIMHDLEERVMREVFHD